MPGSIRAVAVALLLVGCGAGTAKNACADEVEQWIADLNSDSFAKREDAQGRLAAAGKDVYSRLAKVALAGHAEPTRRALRVLQQGTAAKDRPTHDAAKAALRDVIRQSEPQVARAAKESLFAHEKAAIALLSKDAEFRFHDDGHVKSVHNLVEYGGNPGLEDRDLPHLAAFRELVHLDLTGEMFANDGYMAGAATDAGVEHLKALDRLEELSIEGLTDEGVRKLSALKSLRSLELDCPRMTPEGLAHLRSLTRLKSLKITGGGIYDLSTLGAMPALRTLEVNAPLKETALSGLAELGGLTSFAITIPASEDQIAHVANVELPQLRHLTKLERLTCNNIRVGDDGLAGIRDLTELREVWLSHSQLSDAGLEHLRNLKKLERLTLYSNYSKVTGTGLKHLANLKELRTMSLGGLPLTAEGLRQMPVLPALEELGAGSRDPDASVPAFKGMKRLKRLDFGPINDQILSQLEESVHIEYLNCSPTVTDAGAASLGKITGLKALYAAHTQITDAALAHWLPLRRLESLSVSKTRITDESAKHLAKLSKLKYLYIGDTKITDRGLAELTALQELTELYVSTKQFAPEAVKHFCDHVPGCKVVVSD